MKQTIKFGMCISIAVLSASSNFTFGQFVPAGGNNWRTIANVNRVGVGNTIIINSAFQIDGNTVATPTGEVLRTDCPIGNTTNWRMFRGGTQFGRLFNVTGSNHFTLEASQQDMLFNAGGATERMRIVGTDRLMGSPIFATVRAGNVGIETPNPLTKLHIGGDGASGAGWRTWMDIGTFYGSRSGSDNMYIGLKLGAYDVTEAIVSWGNNPSNISSGDRMRFVFTAAPGNGTASGADGLEIARMWSNGNAGRMGIGNFFTPNVDPINTLEIRSDVPTTTLNPINATAQTRSGLRFTNLNSTLAVDANNNTNTSHLIPTVLSVNESGDVILVNGNNIGTCTTPTILSSGNGALNLNNNNFYFVGSSTTAERVSVGVACGNTLTSKFNVNGNSVIGNGYIGTVNPPANGLLVQGFTGIGGSFTNANPPARQLDIFNNTAPQLRLTQAFPFFLAPAKFTDFQTTSGGNLRINPSDGLLGFGGVGINIPAGQEPQSTLELNTLFLSTTSNGAGGTGISGLRFSDLNSSCTPVTSNPGTGVLSVNTNGDVIYVPGGGGSAFGTCSGTPTTLSANSATNLNNKKLYFLGNGVPSANQIGVGYTCNSAMLAKFNVFQESYDYSIAWGGGVFVNYAIAGDFFTNSPSGTVSMGVMGRAYSPSGANYGVYGAAPTGANNFAGFFNGNIKVNSTVYTSDSILKENIVTVSDALNTVRELQPRKFNFKTNDFPYLNLPGGNQFGFIAQEIGTSLSELVTDITEPAQTDTAGNIVSPSLTYKGLNYTGLIPITIQAVKELDSTVTTLLPPPPTTLIAPANGDTGLPVDMQITFVWNSSPNTDSYLLYISPELNPTGKIYQYSVTDTTFNNFFAKQCNHTFYWWVVSENNNGRSDKSEVWSFSTGGPGIAIPPTLAAPANGDTTSLGNQFTWLPVSNAASYILYISASPNGEVLISNYWTSDTTIYLTLPFDNFSYYWWVKSWNCSGESVPSEIRSFYARSYVAPKPPEYPSDSAYKLNVSLIDSALEKVMQLNGVNFDWNRAQFPQMHFDSARTIGFIAQQVRPVVPEIVHQNDTGALSVDYGRLSALLTEAIKQQQQTITFLTGKVDSLALLVNQQQNNIDSTQSAQIATMQYCIDNLPSGMGCNDSIARKANPNFDSGNEKEVQKLVLESSHSAILYQNEPNPFGNSTLIRYYVPENTKEAMLVFYDEFGREITKESLQQKGYAKVDVNAEKLTAGIYTYSLIVDGKVTDTKKMIRTK